MSVLLASCSSTSDPALSLAMPGYNSTEFSSTVTADASSGSESEIFIAGEAQQLMTIEGDTALPDQVAYMPVAKPGSSLAALAAANGEAESTLQAQAALLEQAVAQLPENQQANQQASQQTIVPIPQTNPDAIQSATAQTAEPTPPQPVQHQVAAIEPVAQPQAPKKKGFLAGLFSGGAASNTTKAQARPARQPVKAEAKPVITLASAQAKKPALASTHISQSNFSGNALPGVRQDALFEIKRKSGLDDDSDIDLNEDEGSGSYQVASAAGLARLAPNGLLTQTESVDVACLKPSLVRVLKTIENHYGKKLVVTSGYRDPSRNQRARGAKNSLHMYCAAADIQVPGVSKWELATYLRSMPGRGGVGTYCHTDSVHVDVGPERDWNWRCRRRK
ncbi:D-Ala-D-Ala carboxypeptidase family metallohydrolase [Aquamicrobium segne]|uniref:Murein endopeptidase K n=1 Tax=Aquamicrobium segne TaxID=469547 RepID=A0ABW0H2L5_9HYPH